MGVMDSSFERALTRRLRSELNAVNVAVPAATRPYSRRGDMRYLWAVGRPLAVGLAAALLLGSVAAYASGSPNPAVWVKTAERSLGIQPPDDKTPIGPKASPSPHPTESPDRTERSAQPSGPEREPVETSTPERASPEGGHSLDAAEHSPAASSGDG
jgi:hypothetical protein